MPTPKEVLETLIEIVDDSKSKESELRALRLIILGYKSSISNSSDSRRGGSCRGRGRSDSSRGRSGRDYGSHGRSTRDQTVVEKDPNQDENVRSLFKDVNEIPGASICKKYFDTFDKSLQYEKGELKAYLVEVVGLEAFHPNKGHLNVSYRLPTDDAGEAQESSTAPAAAPAAAAAPAPNVVVR